MLTMCVIFYKKWLRRKDHHNFNLFFSIYNLKLKLYMGLLTCLMLKQILQWKLECSQAPAGLQEWVPGTFPSAWMEQEDHTVRAFLLPKKATFTTVVSSRVTNSKMKKV